MIRAIQIPIANCSKCGTSYNYSEFSALAELSTQTRSDDLAMSKRQCEACPHYVLVAGYSKMVGSKMWDDWGTWRARHPDTTRRPVMIPQNTGDRLWLWRQRNETLISVGALAAFTVLTAALAVVLWGLR